MTKNLLNRDINELVSGWNYIGIGMKLFLNDGSSFRSRFLFGICFVGRITSSVKRTRFGS